jgi:hypothetical protein
VEHQATLSLARADGVAVSENRRLAIDISRADIETALRRADDDLELVLDLEAGEVNGGATRRHTLAIGCTREDFERMMENDSDNVSVSFNAEALALAIGEADVEAHSLREKMAVLAVVVATTGAAAGSAQAMPVHGGGSGGATVTSTRDMPADSVSASAAVAAAGAGTQMGPYSGGAPFQGPQAATQAALGAHHRVLPSGHHAAPPMVIDSARDLPSDSVKASQAPGFAHGAATTQGSSPSSDDTSSLVIIGGITLVLLGGAVGVAAAAAHRPVRPT